MPRPLSSFLPFGSFVYFRDHYEGNHEALVGTFHVLYAFGSALIPPSVYLTLSLFTGSWNPAEQLRIRKYWKEEMQVNQRQSDELQKQIFGPGGFADTNFDKKVDIVEKAESYKKLGLTDFPEGGLSLKQLEELVKKYRGN